MLSVRESLISALEVLYSLDDSTYYLHKTKTLKTANTVMEKFFDSKQCNDSRKISVAFILLGILGSSVQDNISRKCDAISRKFAITVLNSLVVRNIITQELETQRILLSKLPGCHYIEAKTADCSSMLPFPSLLGSIFESMSCLPPNILHSVQIEDTSLYRHILISVICLLSDINPEMWRLAEREFFHTLLQPKTVSCYLLIVDIVRYFQRRNVADFSSVWVAELFPRIMYDVPIHSPVGTYLLSAIDFLDPSISKAEFPCLPDDIEGERGLSMRGIMHLSIMPLPYKKINMHIRFCLHTLKLVCTYIRSEEDIDKLSAYYCSAGIIASFGKNLVKRMLDDNGVSMYNAVVHFAREVSDYVPMLIAKGRTMLGEPQAARSSVKLMSQTLSCYVTLYELSVVIAKITNTVDWRLWHPINSYSDCEQKFILRAVVFQGLMAWRSARDDIELRSQNTAIKWLWSTNVWYERFLAMNSITDALRYSAIKRDSLDGLNIEHIRNFVKKELPQFHSPDGELEVTNFIMKLHNKYSEIFSSILQRVSH